jgi:hypothetical protein
LLKKEFEKIKEENEELKIKLLDIKEENGRLKSDDEETIQYCKNKLRKRDMKALNKN